MDGGDVVVSPDNTSVGGILDGSSRPKSGSATMAQSMRSSHVARVELAGAADLAPNDECLPGLTKVGNDKQILLPQLNTGKRSTARKRSTALPLASKPFVISAADKERKRLLIASDIEYHRTYPDSVVDSIGSMSHELAEIVKPTNSGHRIQSMRPFEPAQLRVSPAILSSWNLPLVDSRLIRRSRIRRKSKYLMSVLKMISRDERALSTLSTTLEKSAMLMYYSNCFYNSNGQTSPALLNGIASPASTRSDKQTLTRNFLTSEQPFESLNATNLFMWLKHSKFVEDRAKALTKPFSCSVFIEESKVNGKEKVSNSPTFCSLVEENETAEPPLCRDVDCSKDRAVRIAQDKSNIRYPTTENSRPHARVTSCENVQNAMDEDEAGSPKKLVVTHGMRSECDDSQLSDCDAALERSSDTTSVVVKRGKASELSFDGNSKPTSDAKIVSDSCEISSPSSALPGTPITPLSSRLRTSQHERTPVPLRMAPTPDIIALTPTQPPPFPVLEPSINQSFLQNYVTENEAASLLHSIDDMDSWTNHDAGFDDSVCLMSCSSLTGKQDDTIAQSRFLPSAVTDSFPKWNEIISPQLSDQAPTDVALSSSEAKSPVRISETITSSDLVCNSLETNAHCSILSAPLLPTEAPGRDAPSLEDAESLKLKIETGMNLHAVPEDKEEVAKSFAIEPAKRLTEESGDHPCERVLDRMCADESEVDTACEFKTEKFEKANREDDNISEAQKVSKKRSIEISDAQKDNTEPVSKKRHIEIEIEERPQQGQERESSMLEIRHSVCEKVQPLNSNEVERESENSDTPRRYHNVGIDPSSCSPEGRVDYNPTVVTNRSGVIDAGDGIIIYTSVAAWDEEKGIREQKSEYEKQAGAGQRPNVDCDSMQHYMISVT